MFNFEVKGQVNAMRDSMYTFSDKGKKFRIVTIMSIITLLQLEISSADVIVKIQGGRVGEICDTFWAFTFPFETHAYESGIGILFKGHKLVRQLTRHKLLENVRKCFNFVYNFLAKKKYNRNNFILHLKENNCINR